MAFPLQISSLSICRGFVRQPRAYPGPMSVVRPRSGVALRPVQCVANFTRVSTEENVTRRSANYQAPIWHFDYVQSLQTEYTGKQYRERVEILKEEVREILKKLGDDLLAQLEHVDLLQRLGLSYHFEAEIKSMLEEINNNKSKTNNLYATALEFRLLRQHGYRLPQGTYDSFPHICLCVCVCHFIK